VGHGGRRERAKECGHLTNTSISRNRTTHSTLVTAIKQPCLHNTCSKTKSSLLTADLQTSVALEGKGLQYVSGGAAQSNHQVTLFRGRRVAMSKENATGTIIIRGRFCLREATYVPKGQQKAQNLHEWQAWRAETDFDATNKLWSTHISSERPSVMKTLDL